MSVSKRLSEIAEMGFFALLFVAGVFIVFQSAGTFAQMTTLLLRGETVEGKVVAEHTEMLHTSHGVIPNKRPVVEFEGRELEMSNHADYVIGEACKVLIDRTSGVAAHLGKENNWAGRLKACSGIFLVIFPLQVLLGGLWYQWRSFRKVYRPKWRKLRKVPGNLKRCWVQAKALESILFGLAVVIVWTALCWLTIVAAWELPSDNEVVIGFISSGVLVLAYIPLPALAFRLKSYMKGQEFKLWLPFVELFLAVLMVAKLVQMFVGGGVAGATVASIRGSVLKMLAQLSGVDLP